MSGYKRQSDYLLARIGTITNKHEIVRRTMEQTACNYYEITVPARTEVVLYHEVRRGSTGGGNLRFVFPGTCTDEHWVNRLLGSSSLAEKRSVGKPMSDWHRPYDYLLLNLMLGDEYEIVLDEGVNVTADVKTLGREPGREHTPHTAVYARIDLDTPLYRDESETS